MGCCKKVGWLPGDLEEKDAVATVTMAYHRITCPKFRVFFGAPVISVAQLHKTAGFVENGAPRR
jgi:hypothetical protein